MKAKLIKDIVDLPGYWLSADTEGTIAKSDNYEWDYEFTPHWGTEGWYVDADEVEVIEEGDADGNSKG